MRKLDRNKLSLGLFGCNCSGGLAITTVPERWDASWENNRKLARLADDVSLEQAAAHLAALSQQMEQAYIHVDIRRFNGACTFEVINSKPAIAKIGKEQSLGKGLENLHKRLQLSYPRKHSLELADHPGQFSASLKIEIE